MATIDDSFISDDEEEYCPLCVEEMDISDKNFKPCPCGYQICQFCYNNIKQSPELNGRCPGCRRLYDDASVEYKTITAEEYKLQQLKKEKREREKKQKEKEKKENELANKKHLAGIRVVQKNLVYVTGLNPPCNPEDLHSILRSDRYFGRYGKILKIVINKKTPNPAPIPHHNSNPGLVVYVTFAKKEDALKCINDMDGSLLDGKILRAAHGTTKYCSSYLRGHPCQNPNCMFLHEPGEEADSYTRKDLSTQQGIKMGMMKRVSSSSNFDHQNTSLINEEEYEEDQSNISQSNISQSNISQANISQSNISQPNISQFNISQTNINQSQTSLDSREPSLPVTAHWAKATTSSPAVNNNVPLANVSAFPTLSEVLKDQKPTTPTKASKKKKKDLIDDSDYGEEIDNKFLTDISNNLIGLTFKREKLPVKFSEEFEEFKDSTGSVLPLFLFNRNLPSNLGIDNAQEKRLSRKIVETYLLRPIKNYHLAYQNHPIIQQQILLQEQQQKMTMDSAQQQQQQQLLLLQQLQKQQSQQEQLQNQGQVAAGQQQTPQAMHQQTQQVRAPIPQQGQTPTSVGAIPVQGGAPPGLVNNNSSSSQLLTQLMSGKR